MTFNGPGYKGRMLRPQIVGLAVWALAFSPIPASSQPTPTRAPHTVVTPNPNPAALQPVELTDPAHPPGAGRPGEAGALTVESSVKLGLKTNPSIKVADERVATAVAQYEQSSSQKNPQLVFSDTTSMRPNPVVISTSPLVAGQGVPFPSDFTIISQVQSQINMSLQVLLTSFGRVEHQIAASYLNIDAQAKSTDLDRRNLTLQIKQAFLQHLKTLAAQEAANANLVVTEQNLKDTNALFHQGILAKFDSVQAELQVVQATQDLQQRKTQIKTTAATLRALLLLPQQDPLLLVPPPPIVVDPEVDVPRLQALALTHRPELISLSRQMDVAKALLDAAHCEGNPQVGMNLTYLTNPGNNL